MDPIVDVLRLMMQRRGVRYELLAPDEFLVQHGSAEVRVTFRRSSAGGVIALSAEVLSDCDIQPGDELRVLRSLNERNRAVEFGKFFLDEHFRTVVLRHEILGDHLQDEELLHALGALARTADDQDDALQDDFGTGLRASDRGGQSPVGPAF
jgi:hypothetical protein